MHHLNLKSRIKFITLGCSKNRVDSEHILYHISKMGLEISLDERYDPNEDIDAVIINTCGFIKDAKEESIEAIFTAVEAKQRGYVKKIFVFGCLSQRYRDELSELIPEVDGFFGVTEPDRVLKALGGEWSNNYCSRRYLTTPSHYAYLKISEGCDRTCSYCSIPLIRGAHRSVPAGVLVDEATNLALSGVKELILIAQDTTYWGLDIGGKRALASLMERLSEIDGIEWIRLLYSYPASFPQDVLELMASNSKICKYIDIPLQHVNDRVLSNMRRSIDGATTMALIDKIRERVPGVTLRTTMIVGHPGEDKRAFNELLNFVERVKFDRLGAFTYSEEEGTWGALNLKDSVNESEKQERYERLMELQSSISKENNLKRVGTVERILIDHEDDNYFVGRSMRESPEVDGEILISKSGVKENFNRIDLIGTFVEAKIISGGEYDLIAEIL